jgi:hypothetical protein
LFHQAGIQTINLEKAFHPRKTRNSLKKTIDYIRLSTHQTGDTANSDIPLILFVFFRDFRGQWLFLGLNKVPRSGTTPLFCRLRRVFYLAGFPPQPALEWGCRGRERRTNE